MQAYETELYELFQINEQNEVKFSMIKQKYEELREKIDPYSEETSFMIRQAMVNLMRAWDLFNHDEMHREYLYNGRAGIEERYKNTGINWDDLHLHALIIGRELERAEEELRLQTPKHALEFTLAECLTTNDYSNDSGHCNSPIDYTLTTNSDTCRAERSFTIRDHATARDGRLWVKIIPESFDETPIWLPASELAEQPDALMQYITGQQGKNYHGLTELLTNE